MMLGSGNVHDGRKYSPDAMTLGSPFLEKLPKAELDAVGERAKQYCESYRTQVAEMIAADWGEAYKSRFKTAKGFLRMFAFDKENSIPLLRGDQIAKMEPELQAWYKEWMRIQTDFDTDMESIWPIIETRARANNALQKQ